MTSPYVANESALWIAARRTRLQDFPSRIAMYKNLVEGYLEEAPNHGPPDKDPKPKEALPPPAGIPPGCWEMMNKLEECAWDVERVGMPDHAQIIREGRAALATYALGVHEHPPVVKK